MPPIATGAAVSRAQQAVDDLQLALLAVAVVAALRQFAAAALQIARRHVVEHQRAGARDACARAPSRPPPAARGQPVEGDVEFVFVNRSQDQASSPRLKAGGERVEHAGSGELGRRRRWSRADDHRDDEVAAAVARRPEQTIKGRFRYTWRNNAMTVTMI